MKPRTAWHAQIWQQGMGGLLAGHRLASGLPPKVWVGVGLGQGQALVPVVLHLSQQPVARVAVKVAAPGVMHWVEHIRSA